MNKKFFAFLFLFLFAITLVSSVPATQIGNLDDLCEITYPQYQYLVKDTAFNLSINVFDTFQGEEANYGYTDCYLKFTTKPGTHPIDNDKFEFVENDLEVFIPASAVSSVGETSFLIRCNGTFTDKTLNPDENFTGGCFANGVFEVTTSGKQPPQDSTLVFFLIGFFAIFGLAMFSFMWVLNKLATADVTINNVVLSFASYFAYLGFYYLAWNYWGNTVILDFLETFLWVLGFMNLFVVVVIFVISLVKRFGEMQ